MTHIPQDTYLCDLLFEAYGARDCAFCRLLIKNDWPPKPNFRSVFMQEAVAAHGSLSWIRSLTALDRCEGGLVDLFDGTGEARFGCAWGLGDDDCTVKFTGPWALAEQLDLLEALRLGLEAGCSHSWRARMRIERK